MSSDIRATDRTKSLTSSSSTDDKLNSVDTSTFSLDHSPQLPNSSTLPSEQSQIKSKQPV